MKDYEIIISYSLWSERCIIVDIKKNDQTIVFCNLLPNIAQNGDTPIEELERILAKHKINKTLWDYAIDTVEEFFRQKSSRAR